MILRANAVVAALKKKGFLPSNSHHVMFLYQKKDGTLSGIRTRVSHNSGDINDYLIGQMAKQVILVMLTITTYIGFVKPIRTVKNIY